MAHRSFAGKIQNILFGRATSRFLQIAVTIVGTLNEVESPPLQRDCMRIIFYHMLVGLVHITHAHLAKQLHLQVPKILPDKCLYSHTRKFLIRCQLRIVYAQLRSIKFVVFSAFVL